MNIFNWIPDIIGGVGKITKTFVGSQQQRDQQNHDEFQTVQASYQAEYTNSGGWFNGLVDGINRLVRPLFTFGTIALFGWAIVEPAAFITAMGALKTIPIELWTIQGTIIAFWFGSKSIFGDRHKYSYQFKAPKIATKHRHEIITEDDTPQDHKQVPVRNVDNDVVRAWLKTQN